MLAVLRSLFGGLDAAGIDYVVWKSLEQYKEQLDGEGDVDVLFDADQRDRVYAFMADHAYVEDLGTPALAGLEVRVFRGIDSETLAGSSIHTYFRCRIGSKQFKEYRFPYEREMFAEAHLDQGVRRACDGHFIVTRVLMVTLRKNWQDVYVCELAHRYRDLSEKDRGIIDRHIGDYFGVPAVEVMDALAQGEPAVLEQWFEHVHKRMDDQNPVAEARAEVVRNRYRETGLRAFVPGRLRYSRNKLDSPMGILLAGHDGTGKTTVSELVARTLQNVAPVRRIYMGRKWSFLNRVIDAQRGRHGGRILQWIWPLTSTLEILARWLWARFLVFMGFFVVFDRAFADLNIKYGNRRVPGSWFPLRVARLLSQRQAELCFLLEADPEVVRERKGKHTGEEIRSLQEKYRQLLGDVATVIDTSELPPVAVAARVLEAVYLQAGARQLANSQQAD